MKKKFFDPSSLNKNYLPNMVSRRIFGTSRNGDGSTAYRSGGRAADDDDDDDEDDDDDDDNDVPKEQRRLLKTIHKRVTKIVGTRATKDDVNQIMGKLGFLEASKDGKTPAFPIEALRELADPDKGALKMLTEQGLKLKQLETTLAQQPEDMSVRSQCKKYLEQNKETIKKILEKRNATALMELPMFELELRAVNNPMLPANTMPSSTGSLFITSMEIERGVTAEALPVPTLWDSIPKGNTNAETYVWVNKRPREGAAAFIAPGVYKPNISFTIDSSKSHAKKVAASEKMALELLQDIDGFVDWVESELRNAVMMEANSKVTTGVASDESPDGIRTLSVPFQGASLGLKVVKPNYWDAIKAGVTMLKAQKRFSGRKVTVFVHPVDKANADMTKAQEQGQLFVPATIDARILEDSDLPIGHVQFAVLDAYKIKIYKGFSMAWGWENDDFTKNLVTVIGEMRIHQYVKDIDNGAFVYDTFDNIINGIDATPEAA